MKNEMQGIQGMLGGKLVTGDHDSISIFGAAAQSDLNQISRKITDTVQKRFSNQENMMDEARVIAAIEQIEDSLRAYKSNRWGGFLQKKRQREYDTTLDTIESLSTSLKLRQVELLREIKIFERLIASLKVCETNLTECISTGEILLQNQPTEKKVRMTYFGILGLKREYLTCAFQDLWRSSSKWRLAFYEIAV